MSKTFIVTGASRGIGLAIATGLIDAQQNVILLARSANVLNGLQQQHPRQVRIVVGDLKEHKYAEVACTLALKEFGQINGLFLNHGAMFGIQKIADCNVNEWRDMLDINFLSAVAFTKAALPALRKSRGCIIYTSSGASTSAYSAWGPYTAGKAALNMLAKQVAAEEPEVIAYAIRPGVVDTDMQRDLRDKHAAVMDEKDNAKFKDLFESSKILRPEQPGNVMMRLGMNPDAKLNGQYLSWDSVDLEQYRSK